MLEFQAVILAAGTGSRMPELTVGKPKCLLPVGPVPLVWYPLRKLQDIGFKEVIMVVLAESKQEIEEVLSSLDLTIKIDYVSIEDEDLGTADSLRLLHDRFVTDIIVIPCDLITDVDLSDAINLFRMHKASLVTLFFHPFIQSDGGKIVPPGPKSKYNPERDLIGIDSQTDRLVFMASASDFEDVVSLPKRLLRKHRNIKMLSNLLDSHIYIIRRWIIDYLEHQPNISSIKGELLPRIVKQQMSKPPTYNSSDDKSIIMPLDTDNIYNYCKEDKDEILIRQASNCVDHCEDLRDVYHTDRIRCYISIPSKTTFGVRVNTIPVYWAIKNQIQNKWQGILGHSTNLQMVHAEADIKSNQVDEKCIIWRGVKLAAKTSFKNSILCSNTQVDSFSRVFNCIVMDNVIVKESVVLEDCIVCEGVVIERGCQIKNCIIGSQHTIPEGSEHQTEILTMSDHLMEF